MITQCNCNDDHNDHQHRWSHYDHPLGANDDHYDHQHADHLYPRWTQPVDLETLWSQQPSLPPYMTEYRWASSSLNHHDPCMSEYRWSWHIKTQFKVNHIRIKASLMIFISRIRTGQLAQLPLRGNFFWKISCCRTFRTYAEYAHIFKNLLQKKWWTWWSYGPFRP